MPKPFKLTAARPLPPDAEIVDRDGKPHVRIRERNRTACYPLTADGTKFLRPSPVWYFWLRTADGRRHRVKGFGDLRATEQRAAEMQRQAERGEVGMVDPHAARPLADHLKDYAAHLEAKGNCERHNDLTAAQLAAMAAECEFKTARQLDAGKVAAWLTARRRDGEAVTLPAGVAAFTPAEAAAALGVTVGALAKAIRRHGLTATGQGKARRIPRAAVEVLAANRAKGTGPETTNHYVRAAKGFARWMVKTGRLPADPFATLTMVNARTDVRRGRRELPAVDLGRLFAATRASGRTLRDLTGEDRYTLYLTAAGSGFRANALANLTPADFSPDARTATLPARFNKSRRAKVQPLPPDVAAELVAYLEGKPAGQPVWGGTWAEKAAEMLRADLEAAGIPYAVPGPDGPRYADFHALRHSYLTALGRSGVDLRTAQLLAGHSSPTLTARYMHKSHADLTDAVGKLTGFATAPEGPGGVSPAVPPAVPTGHNPGHSLARPDNGTGEGVTTGEVAEPLEMKPGGTFRHRPSSSVVNEPGGDRTHDPQIKSLLAHTVPALENKAIPPAEPTPSTTRCTKAADLTAPTPPDLAGLLAGLAALTAEQRAALVALLSATSPPTPPPPPATPADDADLLPWERRSAKAE